MTPRRRQRMILIGLVLGGVAVSTWLALTGSGALEMFYSPTQVAAGEAPDTRTFRLGGMVLDGSVERETGSLTVSFVVTDFVSSMPVRYTGVLPDLFVEGSGVVTRGQLHSDGYFVAEEVLAKHDENYMSPEVAEALAQAEEADEP